MNRVTSPDNSHRTNKNQDIPSKSSEIHFSAHQFDKLYESNRHRRSPKGTKPSPTRRRPPIILDRDLRKIQPKVLPINLTRDKSIPAPQSPLKETPQLSARIARRKTTSEKGKSLTLPRGARRLLRHRRTSQRGWTNKGSSRPEGHGVGRRRSARVRPCVYVRSVLCVHRMSFISWFSFIRRKKKLSSGA